MGAVLVTGAAGFVGANLCRRLVAVGEDVHALVRPGVAPWRLRGLGSNLALHHIDLCDHAAVRDLVRAVRPRVVHHLATYGAYPEQRDADRAWRVNVTASRNLLEACADAGLGMFVNTGSSSEYGRKREPMRETDVLEPNSVYAVTKAAQTLLLRQFAEEHQLPAVTLRLFSVYGPYEEPTRLIPKLMMAVLDGTPMIMAAPDTARDFAYVDDVVEVYLAAARAVHLRGEILNVGTGVESTLRDVIEIAGEVCGPVDARWNAMEPRSWDTARWVADPATLRRTLGSHMNTTLRDGLARTFAWFRTHHELYR